MQGVEADVEHGVFINGYPSAADFLTSDPDHSFSIYKSFHRLSSRNLLYLEAELFELQKHQDDIDIEDSHQGLDTLQYFRSWNKLSTSADPRQKQRLDLIKRIRAVLKEYYETLVLQESVLKMERPQSRTVEAVQTWLNAPNGRHAPSFSGLAAKRLDDESDLVALHPPFEKDWLSRLVDIPYLRFFCLDSHIDESVAVYSMRKVNRVAAMLSMLLAAILFVGAIMSLYLVTNNNLRLGLICIFTIAFSLSIHLLTNARRAELLASTAAYAAVLVVFVSGNLGSTCCNNSI